MTSFDKVLAEDYYRKVFGNLLPIKLGEILPDTNRTYNLMYESDSIEPLLKRFGIGDELSGGVYTFWWLGGAKELNAIDAKHFIKGKKESAAEQELREAESKELQRYEVDKDGHIKHEGAYNFHDIVVDNGKDTSLTVCPLYVGKTSLLKNRIRLHLQWPGPGSKYKEKDAASGLTPIKTKYKDQYIFKHTTACQFRAGFEYLFRDECQETRTKYLYNNIGISIATTASDVVDGFEDRFFTEDLLIGAFRAPFNLDSER